MFKIFEVLRQGKSLANAETWKNVAGATIALAAVINAGLYIAKMFIDLPEIPSDVVLQLSAGIVAPICFYLNYATSEKVGLPSGENK
jgi:hypothetical protein